MPGPEPGGKLPRLGKLAWELGARNWTSYDTHPIMGRDNERSQAIKARLTRFIPELSTAGSILDIGSGGGLHFYVRESVPPAFLLKVTALDFSPAMLEGNPSAYKIEADVRRLLDMIPDDSYDIVTQFFVNRYLTPAEQAQELGEIARVTAKNKRVILLDHTDMRGQLEEVATFDPHALIETPAGKHFQDWEIEEVIAEHTSEDGTFHQGPLYLLTGIKK